MEALKKKMINIVFDIGLPSHLPLGASNLSDPRVTKYTNPYKSNLVNLLPLGLLRSATLRVSNLVTLMIK